MEIERFEMSHSGWRSFAAHLDRTGDARWVLDEDGKLLPSVFCLGAKTTDDSVIGHISIHIRDIAIPATEWSNGKTTSVVSPDDNVLQEAFVNSFAVEGDYRRRGYGTALQFAALELSQKLECYQMRSWCSLDKLANYALKIRMRFAMYPATSEAWNGTMISGVYFVKKV